MNLRRLLLIAGFLSLAALHSPALAGGLSVGFAARDISPDLKRPVWLAGFQPNRRATTIHDPLMARALVLGDGVTRIALVSVDLIGLQYQAVQKIRTGLPDVDYCLVASTHTHHGPDTIGLWGPSPLVTGVDPAYLDRVCVQTIEAVKAATAAMQTARASYGTTRARELLHDSRLPKVYDDVLRVIAFTPSPPTPLPQGARGDGPQPLGILVQWNCHPEVLGRKNHAVTADFPSTVVADLAKRYACPIVYFSGPLGGLMSPPEGLWRDAAGRRVPDETIESMQRYGADVAEQAAKAVEQASPCELTPLEVSAAEVALPLDNPWYLIARSMGVVARPGFYWTGSRDRPGDRLTPQTRGRGGRAALVTEVACLRLGDVLVACLPGEIYPELAYGEYPSAAEPGVDFPEAPLETPITQLLPNERVLLLGLANDEIGYIIPRRQWDARPPFAYGKPRGQYGEINSVGPDAAPLLIEALADRVRTLGISQARKINP